MTTLVLLHGWGAGGGVWDRQAAAFKDFPKFNLAQVLAPTIPVWEADWLAAYLGALPLKECLLVGWSLGGMLLLEAVSRLIGPPPRGVALVGEIGRAHV